MLHCIVLHYMSHYMLHNRMLSYMIHTYDLFL